MSHSADGYTQPWHVPAPDYTSSHHPISSSGNGQMITDHTAKIRWDPRPRVDYRRLQSYPVDYHRLKSNRSRVDRQGAKQQKRESLEDICLQSSLDCKSGGYLLSHLRSTIGVIGLNCSVRDGKRWIPNAIATLIISLFPSLLPNRFFTPVIREIY